MTPDGSAEWRTRLYHDESSETADIAGVAVEAWAPWIAGQLAGRLAGHGVRAPTPTGRQAGLDE